MTEPNHSLERTRARPLMSKTAWEVVLILFVTFIYILPQIQQQLVLDKLPQTGDLIHRRIVFFLTNFPNFQQAPELISGHSQFYHKLIADTNILTGLTGDKSFYGMTLVNLLLLPVAALVLYILARRLSIPFPVLAPLLFLSNPLLVGPFLGHSNQHLIFLSVAIFLFVLFFLQPRFPVHIITLLVLGVVFNSSMVIYFPFALLLLILDYWYTKYRLLILSSLALLTYLLFLHSPIGYLFLGDYTYSSFTKLAILLAVASGLGVIYYKFFVRRRHVHKILLSCAALAVVGAFLFAREGTPFWRTLRPGELDSAKVGIESVDVFDYLFSINSNKPIEGQSLYLSLLSLLAFLSFLLWIFSRARAQERTSLQLRTLAAVIFLPLAVAFFRLVLLWLNLDYFSRTALYSLHVGRITSISFYLAPLLIAYYLLKRPAFSIDRRSTLFAMVAAVFAIALISRFFFLRTYPNWTQKSYQTLLQTSIEKGNGENLSGAEATYSCKFYRKCSIQAQTDPDF